MGFVKLNQNRTRKETEYAAGDEYECSDAEAAVLIELGYAVAVKPRKIEAAAVQAPERAVQASPSKRATPERS